MERILIAAAILPLALFGGTADAFIKDIEGFRRTRYTDQSGKMAIGYGFTDAAQVRKWSISERDAAAELKRRCDAISARLRKRVGEGNPLTPNEEAAVVSLIYNVGWRAFLGSRMWELLKGGERGEAVANEFYRWVYVRRDGRRFVSRGLAKRRELERGLFLRK